MSPSTPACPGKHVAELILAQHYPGLLRLCRGLERSGQVLRAWFASWEETWMAADQSAAELERFLPSAHPVPVRSHPAFSGGRRYRRDPRRGRHRRLRPRPRRARRHPARSLGRRPGLRPRYWRPRRATASYPRRTPVTHSGTLEHLTEPAIARAALARRLTGHDAAEAGCWQRSRDFVLLSAIARWSGRGRTGPLATG